MRTVFISGHLDLTESEFEAYYAPQIMAAWKDGAHFVVGDARGTDLLAQKLLYALGDRGRVRVFHMFDYPRHNHEFPSIGGFRTDEERDASMTSASTEDLAWVRTGREKSGTAKNLKRRKEGT